jgi:hypothetical protein
VAHPLDQGIQGTGGRYERAPQASRDLVGRHDLTRPQCEQGQERTITLARWGPVGAVHLDVHRAEKSDSHNRTA